MQRVAIIICLKPGAHHSAESLLAQGPPFDLASTTFQSHTVFLTESEAVFVFEGPDAEWELDDLTGDVFHPAVQQALAQWRELVDGEPRLARPVYFWEHDQAG